MKMFNGVRCRMRMSNATSRGVGKPLAGVVRPRPSSGPREVRTLIGVCCAMQVPTGTTRSADEHGETFDSFRPVPMLPRVMWVAAGTAADVGVARAEIGMAELETAEDVVAIIVSCAVEKPCATIDNPKPPSSHGEVRTFIGVCCMMRVRARAN